MPVMAKARIGHFAEAQVLQALEVDYVDESEVLTPADEANHIDKWAFDVPFVCGATNLGEALRRISEGAALIRSKGEAGTGNIVEAVRHLRSILGDIRALTQADPAERYGVGEEARRADRSRERGGGVRTAAGAAVLCRRDRHAGGCLAGHAAGGAKRSSSVRESSRARTPPAGRGRSSRRRPTTTTPQIVAKVSYGLGAAMPGLEEGDSRRQKMADRGW